MTETLELAPALARPDLLADPVAAAPRTAGADGGTVTGTDPEPADTAASRDRYGEPRHPARVGPATPRPGAAPAGRAGAEAVGGLGR